MLIWLCMGPAVHSPMVEVGAAAAKEKRERKAMQANNAAAKEKEKAKVTQANVMAAKTAQGWPAE